MMINKVRHYDFNLKVKKMEFFLSTFKRWFVRMNRTWYTENDVFIGNVEVVCAISVTSNENSFEWLLLQW